MRRADDRGIALCFDMKTDLAKGRWVSEVEDRDDANCLGESYCRDRRQEVDRVGRCWREDNRPVLAHDLRVEFD